MALPQLDAVSPAIVTAAGFFLLAGGVALLRVSWLGKRPCNLPALIGGWLLVAAAFTALTHTCGAEVGATYALLAMSVIAYAVLALGIENRSHKPARVREIALEPEERPSSWSRALAKALLSIPLAGIAAIGVGVAFAVAMPIPTHDRIVIGGLLVPILWGAGMAWTLSDARLLRVTLVLGSVSALGYGIAFLPKLLF